MVRENLIEVLKSLSPREATVLKMHWGLDGYKEMTLEEIGAHFGITRERVRQLEARALRQLKENQHRLTSIMGELQSMPADDVEFSSRASRGTRKT
jgi:RNA polymerase primary sigma factor